MPLVLTTNALVMCPHGGVGTTTPISPIWTVNGGFVTGENDVGALACPFVFCPCVGYQLQSMNLNATQIDGRQVILVTDFQKSFTGLPLMIQDFHTTYDNSTPAPLPPGGGVPPPSPAMADLIPPIVTATALPSSTYSTTSGLPTPIVITYTLTADHPRQWILTLINEPSKLHKDLTQGGPPGALVYPTGGSWTSSPLVITVTLTTPFFTAFTGKSHFYVTGVSERGTSGHFEAVIVVGP